MKYRQRIYYTEPDKALMWDRWQKGESLQTIAQRPLCRLISNSVSQKIKKYSSDVPHAHDTASPNPPHPFNGVTLLPCL